MCLHDHNSTPTERNFLRSKIEPHLNTEGNGLSLLQKLWVFSNLCRSAPGVRGFKKKRRKKYEHISRQLEDEIASKGQKISKIMKV